MNQIPTELEQRAQALRLALIDNDPAAAVELERWLMGEAAAGLLYQDADTLMALRAAVADLAPVADLYGHGRKGDRWRAVWELLHAISETFRPLEQVRLARPKTFPGQLLRLIIEDPGVTPGDLAERTDRKLNQVSNALRKLLDQGLVYRVPQGNTARYFADAAARELTGETSAPPRPRAPSPEEAAGRYPYLSGDLTQRWRGDWGRPAIRAPATADPA